MKEAIQKAIEGGYELLGWEAHEDQIKYDHNLSQEQKEVEMKRLNLFTIKQSALDPLFWQSLGKALGWKDYETCRYGCQWDFDGEGCSHDLPPTVRSPFWRWNWHRFIDHLAEGKEVEEFFNQLLK